MEKYDMKPIIDSISEFNAKLKGKTKKVTITLNEYEIFKAKEISEKVLGKENVSGLFAFWINQYIRSKNN